MKKFYKFLLIIPLCLLFLAPSGVYAATDVNTSAKACVVIEANSGRILYEEEKCVRFL